MVVEKSKPAGAVAPAAEPPITPPVAVSTPAPQASAHPDVYMSPNQGLPSQGKAGKGWDKLGMTADGVLPQAPRDYQQQFGDEVWARYQQGQDRALLVAPTGSGKSLSLGGAAVQLIQQWRSQWQMHRVLNETGWAPANWRRFGTSLGSQLPGPQVLWVTHRDVGVKQAEELFGHIFGDDQVGVLQGKRQEVDRPIIVATAQTLRHQLSLINPLQMGLTILDEAHHYVRENDWAGILKHLGFLDAAGFARGAWPRFLVGATATPDRLSGSPLRDVYGPEGLLQAIDASTLWNRPDRVLLKPEQISVQVNGDVNAWDGTHLGNTLTELFYTTLHRGSQFHHTVVFVSRVAQIEAVVATLNDMGISAEGIHAETKEADRDATWERFKRGETRVLVNVGVVGEIMDIPSIETVVLAFGTESRSRVVQAIGRAMRPDAANPDKKPLVVDLGGNVLRHRLDIQIREVYETDAGGKLIRSRRSQDPGVRPFEPQLPEGIASPEEIVLLGDHPLTTKIADAFQHMHITANDIQRAAYRLGVPSDIIFAYANGLRVPPSLDEVMDLASALGDAQEHIRLAWAEEKATQMNRVDPLAQDLSPAVRTFTTSLRTGFWFHFGGAAHRVPGTIPQTVRARLSGELGMDASGRELWEQRLFRLMDHFNIPGQQTILLEQANAVLTEKGWPVLEPWMRSDDSRAILIHRLKALAAKLGRTPTSEDMNAASGMASGGTYKNRFGSWSKAVVAAGINPTRVLTNKTRPELIADLQSLTEALKRTPTGGDMDVAPGMACRNTYMREFGSWNGALAAAGFTPNMVPTNKTRPELIAELQALAATLKRTPTEGDMDATPGMASAGTYMNVFGSWNGALAAAGFTPNIVFTNKSRAELIADLQTLAKALKRTPTGGDMGAAPGMASASTYMREFGSWNAALTMAGFIPNRVRYDRDQLIADLQALGTKLGRAPNYREVSAAPGMASIQSYVTEFGSLNNALEAAQLTPNLVRRSPKRLIDDLQALGYHLGQTPTAIDIDNAPGMSSTSVYKRVFGSWNQALVRAGFAPNRVSTSKTPPKGKRGLATVEMMSVFAAPVTLPILGVQKLVQAARAHSQQLQQAAEQTLRGGAVMFLGSLGADVVDGLRTGDWSTFKKISPKEMTRDFAALTVGSDVGRRMTQVAVALIPIPASLKSLAIRTGSLSAGFALLNRLSTGEFHPEQLPHDIAVTLAASGTVQFATAVMGQSGILRSAAQFLKLTTTAGKATFLGAVATTVVEMTLMREITRMEYHIANAPNVKKVRDYALKLLAAARDDVTARAQLRELVAQLKQMPMVDEQMVEAEYAQAEKEAHEARALAIAAGVPAGDADWTMTKELRRMERKRDQQIADIREALASARTTLPSLHDAAEFQNVVENDVSTLPEDDKARTHVSAQLRPLNALLVENWNGMARQLEGFLAQN